MVGWYVWRAVLAASMGAFLIGLHSSSINGMFEMQGFQGTFSELFEKSKECHEDPVTGRLYALSDNVSAGCGICTGAKSCGGKGTGASFILGLMVSSSSTGSIFGAFFGGWPSNAIGRKMTLVLSGGIMTLAALFSAVSFHSWLFIIGRGLFGFSKGMSYGIITLYISEISPKAWRGRLVSIIGPVYSMSLIVQFAANCGYATFCLGWRISLSTQAALGLFYAIIMLLLPRTPRWLVLKKRHEEAHSVLSKINGSHNESTTLLDLKELNATTSEMSHNFFGNFAKQFSLTVKWKYFKRVLMSSTLFVFTPILGVFILLFSNSFFCKLNVHPCSSNVIVGVSLFVGGVGASLLIDKVGRKALLLMGTVLLLLLQTLMTSLIQVFNLEEETNEGVGHLLTVLFCACAMVYSASWLTLPWVINSEVFAIETRAFNVAISCGVFWIFSAATAQVTAVIIDSPLGIAGYLYIVIGCTVASFIVVLFTVPETKGVSLERMNELFEKPWLERANLKHYLSCGCYTYFRKWSLRNKVQPFNDSSSSSNSCSSSSSSSNSSSSSSNSNSSRSSSSKLEL